MNFDNILSKYPLLKDDFESVLEWFTISFKDRGLLEFEITQESISKFKKQIDEMLRSLDTFPKDLNRIKKIYKTLESNGITYPIIVDKVDNFILEGRHRVVAQYLRGIKKIDVIYVFTKERSINEIKFKNVENVQFNKTSFGYDYKFDLNGVGYVVNFENIDDITKRKNTWSVSFKFIPKETGEDFDSMMKYLMTNPYSNTGLRVEYQVYSHVISSILKFIELYDPFLIHFDARDKKRYRIYQKLTNNLIKTNNNYKLYNGSVINDVYSFIIIKKDVPKI